MFYNDSRRDSKLDSIIQAIEKIRETKLDLITKTIEKTSSKRDEKLDSMTQTIEKISSVMMNETLTFGPYGTSGKSLTAFGWNATGPFSKIVVKTKKWPVSYYWPDNRRIVQGLRIESVDGEVQEVGMDISPYSSGYGFGLGGSTGKKMCKYVQDIMYNLAKFLSLQKS